MLSFDCKSSSWYHASSHYLLPYYLLHFLLLQYYYWLQSVIDAQLSNFTCSLLFLISCCCIHPLSGKCHSFVHKYVRITVVTNIWLKHCRFKLALVIIDLCFTFIIIQFNPIFWTLNSEFWMLIGDVVKYIYDFLIQHFHHIYLYLQQAKVINNFLSPF